jgi:glutamate/tyrosine decarboxylase-like PLP-dependent enzyme
VYTAAANRNLVDRDEYPRTAAIEQRRVDLPR